MKPYVALLRGINVGGAGKLPMAAFRSLLAGLGYENAKTYIQSGNAVFRAPDPKGQIVQSIANAIEQDFGFRPHVFVLPPDDLKAVVSANPYQAEAEADGAKVHLFFLEGGLPTGALEQLAPFATQNEEAELIGDVLYLHTPEGMGRSKYAEKLSRLNVPMTARNMRSAAAILELAQTV